VYRRCALTMECVRETRSVGQLTQEIPRAQRIEVDGQCVAVLIHGDTGDYIVPPIALDQAGDMVMGRSVLEAIIESGSTVEHPIIHDCTPAQLAWLDQELTRVSAELCVPIGNL